MKLYYPIKEAILSILPIADEVVLALAEGDPDDSTRELVESIGDPRVRIVEAIWDEESGARAYSQLTNVALDQCGGDWCFYVQADEVVHEDDLPVIRARCEQVRDDGRVEGLLFEYLHFFGDYEHYQTSNGWYRKKIRIIRNGLGIRSVRDAQSFRYPDERRLTVAHSGARISFTTAGCGLPTTCRPRTRSSWLTAEAGRPWKRCSRGSRRWTTARWIGWRSARGRTRR